MADQPFSAAIVTPRIAAGLSPNARAKWLFVAAIGTLDWVWMNAAGFRFGDGFLACAAAACALAAIALVYFYTERDERIRDFAHFGAQFLALSLVMIPLEYLAVSTNAPLADGGFVALDQAMGLDWVAWAQWVSAHSLIHSALGAAYALIWLQTILTLALLTIAGGAVLPASNPWIYNGLAAVDDFQHAQQFAALRAGTMHVLGLYNTEGLIQLPSFHTVLAIMLAYNFRDHRWLFAAAVVLEAREGARSAIAGGPRRSRIRAACRAVVAAEHRRRSEPQPAAQARDAVRGTVATTPRIVAGASSAGGIRGCPLGRPDLARIA